MAEDPDDTVRLPRPAAPPPPRRHGLRLGLGLGGAALAATVLAGALLWPRPPAAPAVEAVQPAPQPVAFLPPAPAEPPQAPSLQAPSLQAQPPQVQALLPLPPAPRLPPLATEAEVLADQPSAMRTYRFAAQPGIVVVQFGSLAEQARALNRVAALVEKSGFPRDRVLDDAEMTRRIRATGASPETFYYGHDYRAADLVRFFALADQGGVALTPEEGRLRALVQESGWREGVRDAALISLVRHDLASGIDGPARATILRHELSHGAYFTVPAYAAYALRFWNETLTARERAQFTQFLSRDGYDPANADLMVNETQAYLMHTPDARFFNAATVGLAEARLATLRVLFLTGMPPGWLRDCTVVPAAVLPVRAPRQRPRRGQGFGAVCTRRTLAPGRAPLCRAASSAARRSRR